ncbi:hypothetical protein FS842_003956 [Serendipita sp. 407]|nr:hypothetical protein FRC20_000807 [Serendipita sp. 405]KAG9033377.1 hypothetical protein FS842_003956 [Serendipita sp. 407]
MKLLAVIAAFTAAAFGALASPLELQPPEENRLPGPAGFSITSIITKGSSCPTGGISYTLNPTSTAVTLLFSGYYTGVGPNKPVPPPPYFSTSQRRCSITLSLRIPSGYKLSIPTVAYHGYYHLEERVIVTHRAACAFLGQGAYNTATSTRTGPVDGLVDTLDTFDRSCSAWTCTTSGSVTTPLDLNTRIQLSNIQDTSKSGWLTTDGRFAIDLNFSWEKC